MQVSPHHMPFDISEASYITVCKVHTVFTTTHTHKFVYLRRLNHLQFIVLDFVIFFLLQIVRAFLITV